MAKLHSDLIEELVEAYNDKNLKGLFECISQVVSDQQKELQELRELCYVVNRVVMEDLNVAVDARGEDLRIFVPKYIRTLRGD